MQLIFYTADCTGNAKNCKYPRKVVVTNAEDLKEAVRKDHVCAKYMNNYRSVDNFLSSNVIVMDCDNDHTDNPNEWITEEKLAEIFEDIAYGLAPSRNHLISKDGKMARPKFHIYFEIEETESASYYAALKKALHKEYPFFDGNALDAGRFLFGSNAEKVVWHDGWLTIDMEVQPNYEEDSENQVGQILEGSRNNTMSRFAGRVLKRYGNTEKAYEAFLEHAEKCDPPLPEDELKTIWNSAVKFFEKKVVVQKGYVSPDEYNEDFAGSLRPADFSDIGQAKVLAREYGNELRYNLSTEYLRYDGVRWNENREIAVGATEEFLDLQLMDAQSLVESATQKMLSLGMDPKVLKAGGKKAIELLSVEQTKAYEEYLSAMEFYKFVMKRRDYRYIKSCMEAAKPMLYIEYEQLDRDPFLMNTPEGTYDLRYGSTGKREHRAEDYLMKVTAVEPGKQGEDMWKKTLNDIFLGDKELINYVQEVVGLAAVGRVFVEALIIAYGEGRNGKSTFWNTIARVLGLYSGSMAADVLTAGCRRNVAPEKAELKGKRLIIAAELEEGMRLNTSIVKQLCSTDVIRGEKKYKDPADFVPSHQLVLYTNHLPKVGASDAGIWRRLIVIPFNAVFEEGDDRKDFAEELFVKAGPSILAWIMDGAKRVIENDYKLKRPVCVQNAIDKYRKDNDWFGNFLDECCEIDETFTERSGDLYINYRNYADKMGAFKRSNSDFVAALENVGFERKKTKKGIIVKGLRIRQDDFMD